MHFDAKNRKIKSCIRSSLFRRLRKRYKYNSSYIFRYKYLYTNKRKRMDLYWEINVFFFELSNVPYFQMPAG